MEQRVGRVFIYFLLIFYFSLFFAKQINLTTADLGRHITNGKLFVQTGSIISTNFYSYTQPDLPVVNHHWLSGVFFYLLHEQVGFTGLSILYSLMSGLTVFLFFYLAKTKSNFLIALLITLLLMPFMANRKEIRPEGFSYLFLGIYFLLLHLFVAKHKSHKFLYPAFFVLQLAWVNMHIFFIMGLFLVGVFLAVTKSKQMLALFVLTLLASLVNPYGINGLLEPFNIFKEYGYMIIENQSVLFMQKRTHDFIYFYFELVSVVVLFITIHILVTKKAPQFLVYILPVMAFMLLSLRAIRGIPIFGFFAVVYLTAYIFTYYKDIDKRIPGGALAALVLFSFVSRRHFSLFFPGSGYGLAQGVSASADFYVANNLSGPIFNNYDIGGYLIYHLHDKTPVFVDNRPEAYTVEFFKNTYEPAQANAQEWDKLDEQYNFNTIFFYRHDATQWAQPFLIERIRDPQWVPVFVDDYTLILVRNSVQNLEVINKFKIPQEVFLVT